MRCLLALLLAAGAFAQVPDSDSRNTNVPNTDTHFTFPGYDTLERWQVRREHLRRQILFAAGLLPEPERVPLRPEIFGRIEREGYTVEKVFIRTLPGSYLAGNLYRPAGDGPFPAVLKPHGHWNYGRLENQQLGSSQRLAANLALLGFVVFSYDMIGYNDTPPSPHRFSGRREKLWNFGPLSLQLWNSIRALDFISSLDYVDRSRIAITGASGGGTQTFLLAAVDDRLAASAPVNMVSAIMQGGCVCENAPGLRVGAYNVEFAAMMAPKPQLIVSATGDWTRNVPKEEFPDVRSVYALYGKPEMVEAVQFDAPHNYHEPSRVAVYRFFAKHILKRPDAASIEEKATHIEQLPDLLVFYGRPRPRDAVGYDDLFARWRDLVRRRLQAIRDDHERLRSLLQLAVKAEWPERVVSKKDGGAVVLSRPAAADRVPGLLRPGSSTAATLVLHPDGAEAALRTSYAGDALSAGRTVLAIDAFQTGGAVAPRDRSHQHFLTFNLSDDACRVQDVLTALAWLRSQGYEDLELAGSGDAAVWALFAAALAPPDTVRLLTDAGSFQGSDEEFLDRFFIPGIQCAGGLETALRLAGKN